MDSGWHELAVEVPSGVAHLRALVAWSLRLISSDALRRSGSLDLGAGRFRALSAVGRKRTLVVRSDRRLNETSC